MTTVTAITMTAVESSQIAAIGHDATTNTLAIQFASKAGPGSVYHYGNFTADLFAAFAGAESIGSHFGKHIKPFDDKFPFVKIAAPAAPAAAAPAATQSAVADKLLEYELWPDDSEIAAEVIPAIRVIFMKEWGMDKQQADARMSHFNFAAALAGMVEVAA